MSLADVPLILMLVGLTAYAVLGGADFGAGVWQLGGRGERGRRIRGYAYHAMGPVWETNHVWLVFVLVICWTAYPTAFGSITSTLAVPLFIAGIGIILRGTIYALRAATATVREQRFVEVAFALSSILTPFALGAVIGGIASGRVPVGNAAGDHITSWVNWTSAFIGVLAVTTGAYLAAVYLAADAARAGQADLVDAYRSRALLMGVVTGAVALAGLPIVRHDATRIWDGLTGGWGLAAVIVSALAGLATIVLVHGSRFEAARVGAAVAVAAIIAGWAIAQSPVFLPGLTVEQAAAGRSTLVAVIVGTAIGALVLIPSLVLLFALFLGGRFDPGAAERPVVEEPARPMRAHPTALLLALCSYGAGAIVLFLSEAGWARAIGVTVLLVSVGVGFVVLAPAIAEAEDAGPPT